MRWAPVRRKRRDLLSAVQLSRTARFWSDVLDAESMYCAEQINIPDNLGEILKAYSKEVIRQQPVNIYEFSARYFAQLDQQEDDLLDEGVEGLPRDMVFSIVAECNDFARDDLEHSKLRELCEAAGVPQQALWELGEAAGVPQQVMMNALGLMELAEEEERVQWKQFVVALCTQVSGIEDVTAFVKLLMDPLMFGNDDGLIAKVPPILCQLTPYPVPNVALSCAN
ncbi:hypothetical protein T484DRAFT_1770026 [Baffinella frigidus]|nr:hypothetical protein T484DRAFT_1770026 [Cryptophyta sp. CCMP2293]